MLTLTVSQDNVPSSQNIFLSSGWPLFKGGAHCDVTYSTARSMVTHYIL